MKKMLVAVLLLCAGMSYADSTRIARSSFTQTNESAYISTSTYLSKVNVGVASSGGVLKIYNSTWTTSSVLVSSISLGTVGSYDFGDVELKGIYYVVVSNANGFTIIYKR